MNTPLNRTLFRSEFVNLIAAIMSLSALVFGVMLPVLRHMGEALGVADGNDQQAASRSI